MVWYIWLTIINLFILAGTVRFYRLNSKNLDMLDPKRQVFTIHTEKHPLVFRYDFIYSLYHFNVIGSTYHNQVMRDARVQLVEKMSQEGCIEVIEEPMDMLNKRVTLKITLLK